VCASRKENAGAVPREITAEEANHVGISHFSSFARRKNNAHVQAKPQVQKMATAIREGRCEPVRTR
jgi:hypothetical protein